MPYPTVLLADVKIGTVLLRLYPFASGANNPKVVFGIGQGLTF